MAKLMTLSGNWADEMDFSSVAVVGEHDVESINHPDAGWPIPIVFGSNQDGEIYRADINILDVPEGLDPDALKVFLRGYDLDKLISRVLDSVNENLHEVLEEQFKEAFKKAFLDLGLDAIVEMEDAMVARKESKQVSEHIQKMNSLSPNKGFWHCECVTCKKRSRYAKAKYEVFEARWKDFVASSGLDQVPDFDEYGYVSTTIRVVEEAMEEFE